MSQKTQSPRSGKSHPRKVGPYRVLEPLGQGGMGTVYRGFDQRLDRPVALKQIRGDAAADPRSRRRFLREAKTAARLNHPGIVRLHDVLGHMAGAGVAGMDAPDPVEGDWIVMELVEGPTLAELLARGPLALVRVLELGSELADALGAAHREGIVHRDLKSKNVLVDPHGHAKILDFGLAKQVLAGVSASTSLTVEGQIVGTPHAMSPEQAVGRRVDPRSDLFSLGSLLYEMTTGVAPFRGETPMDSLAKVCHHQPPAAHHRMAGVPRALSDLLARLLEKNPGHRPRSAFEIVSALGQLLETLSTAADLQPFRPEGKTPQASLALDGAQGPAPAESLGSETWGRTEAERTASGVRPSLERRQVTVVQAELCAEGDASGSLDPERLYGILDAFETLANEIAEDFQGHVANLLGHRLVLYFGYPRAHEDDCSRAVRAAWRLLERCEGLHHRSSDPGWTARIGVHTGLAVVLGRSLKEPLALGQTLDIASRLQKLGAPGQLLVSSQTRPLILDAFEVGPVDRSGTADNDGVFRVLEAKQESGPWQLVVPQTPLVGRQSELQILEDRLQRAAGGAGQVVLLSGEAGIGKSRLVQALHARVTETPWTWLSTAASPFGAASPLKPIIELLRRTFDLTLDSAGTDSESTDSEAASARLEELLDRLEAGLARSGLSSERVPLFASLLGLPYEHRFAPLGLTPTKQRLETLRSLVRWLASMARSQPLVLLVEDLHWSDPSTLELLDGLIADLGSVPILLVLTFRPELEPPWDTRDNITALGLTRLAGGEATALIDRLTGGRPLPEEVRQQILDKTDGIPLFVEELTKNLLESGLLVAHADHYELTGSLDDLAIPTTLRGSLTARLDRLGTAKEVAQLAATLGRNFSHELLSAVSDFEPHDLRAAMDQLEEAELVHRKGFARRRRYLFRHALIQDAAYDSLLKQQRQGYHNRIGEVLEAQFVPITEEQPELLAHHFTQGQRVDRATVYWLRAGERAFEASASTEAIGHLEQGLGLLPRLDATPERDRLELSYQTTLGSAFVVAKGFAADEVEQAHAQAYALCERVGDAAESTLVLKGMNYFHNSRADFEKALEIAETMIEKAESQSDPVPRIVAYGRRGVSRYMLGQIDAALEDVEMAVACDSPSRTQPCVAFGGDPGVEALSNSSLVLWLAGYPDRALERIDQALDLARQISRAAKTADIAWALSWKVLIHHCRREHHQVASLAHEALACCEEVGVPIWLAQSHVLLGSSTVLGQATLGDDRSTMDEAVDEVADEGIARMRQGVDRHQATGARVWMPYLEANLLEGLVACERVERPVLDHAFGRIGETGERFWEAELHRLDGEMLLLESALEDAAPRAEARFEEALDLAQRQGARSLELRTAISQARLWQRCGQPDAAAALLRRQLESFTEGFDTGDLRAAQRLLDSLAP